jgi:hypothetical protein
MTKFKRGDRVRYNAIDGHAARTDGDCGTVVDDNTPHALEVRWDDGEEGDHSPEYLLHADTARPLVGGPAPYFKAPFKTAGRAVVDVSGFCLMEVDSDVADRAQDEKFAAYTARALNAYVEAGHTR